MDCSSFSLLSLSLLEILCYSNSSPHLCILIEHRIRVYTIKMRLHPIFVLLIPALVTCVQGEIHGAGPVYTVPVESETAESRLSNRDAPSNADYRCGPKIGKCPVGTCCSGAGKY
jgi:hypothetical protein